MSKLQKIDAIFFSGKVSDLEQLIQNFSTSDIKIGTFLSDEDVANRSNVSVFARNPLSENNEILNYDIYIIIAKADAKLWHISRDFWLVSYLLAETNTPVLVLNSQVIKLMEFVRISNKIPAEILDSWRVESTNFFQSLYHSDFALKAKMPELDLRYGENPHLAGKFLGNFDRYFEKLQGSQLSYTNIVDLDASTCQISMFDEPTFAIIKHANTSGIASRENILSAWQSALATDPISVFGGILVANRDIDFDVAAEIVKVGFVMVVAPNFSAEAMKILAEYPNRIVIKLKKCIDKLSLNHYRSALDGILVQEYDNIKNEKWEVASCMQPTKEQLEDLKFAYKIVCRTRTSAISVVKNKQLLAAGIGQTSRADALRLAIYKAGNYGIETAGAVIASEGALPFADTVRIAYQAGIKAIVQPGGSERDSDSVEFCCSNDMVMIFTGRRHFKH